MKQYKTCIAIGQLWKKTGNKVSGAKLQTNHIQIH